MTATPAASAAHSPGVLIMPTVVRGQDETTMRAGTGGRLQTGELVELVAVEAPGTGGRGIRAYLVGLRRPGDDRADARCRGQRADRELVDGVAPLLGERRARLDAVVPLVLDPAAG